MKYANFRPVEVNTLAEMPNPPMVGVMYFVKDEGQIIVNHGDRVVQYPSFELEIEDFPGATLPIAHGGTGANTLEGIKNSLGFITAEDTVYAAEHLATPISLTVDGDLTGYADLNTGQSSISLYGKPTLERTENKSVTVRPANEADDVTYPSEKAVRTELDKKLESVDHVDTADKLSAPIVLNVQGAAVGSVSFAQPGTVDLNLSPGASVEKTANKTTIVRDSTTATDTTYPTEKAVRVELDKKVEPTGTVAKAGALTNPVTINVTGDMVGSVSFSSAGAVGMPVTAGPNIELKANKVTAVGATGVASDAKYPSEKAVRDSLRTEVEALTALIPTGVEKVANRTTVVEVDSLATDNKYPTEKAVRTAIDEAFEDCDLNKGTFSTPADLTSAWPAGGEGFFANVLSTNSIWYWVEPGEWQDSTLPMVTDTAPEKGTFSTPADLTSAYPEGLAGWYALVVSTETVWVWDAATSAWVDTTQPPIGSGIAEAVTSVNGDPGPDVVLSFYTQAEVDAINLSLQAGIESATAMGEELQADLTSVTARVVNLESAGAAEADDILALQGDITDLENTVATLTPRITALETATAGLPAMQMSVDALQVGQLNTMQEIDALDSRVTEAEGANNMQDTRINGLTTDLAAVTASVAGLESTVYNSFYGNASLSQMITNMGGTIDTINNTSIPALDTRLDGFESQVSPIPGQITSISNTLANKVDKVAGSRLGTEAEFAAINNIPRFTSNVNLYVNVAGASDSNDGLTASTAFETLGKALEVANSEEYALVPTVTINFAQGGYSVPYVGGGGPIGRPLIVRRGLYFYAPASATISCDAITVDHACFKMWGISIQGIYGNQIVNVIGGLFESFACQYVGAGGIIKVVSLGGGSRACIINSSVVYFGSDTSLFSKLSNIVSVQEGDVYVRLTTIQNADASVTYEFEDASASSFTGDSFLPMVDGTGSTVFYWCPSSPDPSTIALPAGGSWLVFGQNPTLSANAVGVEAGDTLVSQIISDMGFSSSPLNSYLWAIRISN